VHSLKKSQEKSPEHGPGQYYHKKPKDKETARVK